MRNVIVRAIVALGVGVPFMLGIRIVSYEILPTEAYYIAVGFLAAWAGIWIGSGTKVSEAERRTR